MDNSKILILLVNYFNDDEVIAFIRDELGTQESRNWNVVVTDNGSKDPLNFDRKLKLIDRVDYVNAGSNTGYFNGASIGFEYYVNKYRFIPALTIVSNTDIHFKDKNFLNDLEKFPREYDLLGPSIRSLSSNNELNPFSFARMPKSKLKQLLFIFGFYPFYLAYQFLSITKNKISGKRSQTDSTGSMSVYAIHGSFMIFNKAFFVKGGKLKYPSFLYEEELYVAEQARLLNLRTLFHPSLKVIHNEHSTTGTYKSQKQVRFILDSLRFILHSYYNE